MSTKKDHDFKENLEKCFTIVRQSSTRGISAVEVAEKLGMHRTTVHGYLNTLEYRGKVENQHGTWRATMEEQPKPLEKEIVIELPLPEKEWQRMTMLESMAELFHDPEQKRANTFEIALEKFKETRTIRIKGKNVDDLDLEKLGNLIQQANEKSSKVSLKGLFKSLKRQHTNTSQNE
jgi:biotin operon repressor